MLARLINWWRRPRYSLIDNGETKLSSFKIESGRYAGTEFIAKIVAAGFDASKSSYVIEFLSDPHGLRREDNTLDKAFAKQASAIITNQASKIEDIGMTLMKR